jgi:two-component system nitrate/nitrite response regulator NarL
MASLAVFDPSPLFRAGLAALVSTMGFAPVQEAADLVDLIQRQDGASRPDLMLIGLPQDPVEIAPLMREIRGWAPETRVVFIASALDTSALISCFTAGASGYVLENISREGLKHSLLLVSAGEKVFPSELANALSVSSLQMSDAGDLGRELRELHATEREIEVLRCLADGEPNHAIAAKLGISETAVSADIRHLLRKLKVSNRTQAALWAVAKGLAPPLAYGTAAGRKPRRASSPRQRRPRREASIESSGPNDCVRTE